MLVINAKIVATADTIEAMRDAIAAMETASRAEDGCEDYTFSVELSNPAAMRITERWRDADALKAHFLTPHMADFQAAMAAHPPKSVDAVCYEASEIPLPRP